MRSEQQVWLELFMRAVSAMANRNATVQTDVNNASVLADRALEETKRRFPGYLFDDNKAP